VSFTGALTFIIGLIATIGTSVLLYRSAPDIPILKTYTYTLYAVALAPGVLLTLAGLLGLIGSYKKIRFAMFLFDACQVILFIFFLVLGIIGIVMMSNF
jgi:hypothetical protein